jgi:UDP-N-acetyl-D-glucosamine dehydrogenase
VNVSIIGQGYVGLPLALAAAHAGHQVSGIDLNPLRVKKINSGISPIGDISDVEISMALETGKYQATESFDSLKIAEIIVVCVPTPIDQAKRPDLSYLIMAIQAIAQNIVDGCLVIVESTVSPGTTRGLVASMLDSANVNYYLAYSPERIDPSNKNWNVSNTPKLVAGIDNTSKTRATKFYQSFVNHVIESESLEVIETAKLLENTFRLINISFINEMADFCFRMKIDIREVIAAASTKPYGFMPFYPGAGVGGHCIPVDPSYLSSKAREIGASAKFIELANDVNDSMASFFVKLSSLKLGTLKGKKILLVGIGYKSDVIDVRETPALELLLELRKAGAETSWHDELIPTWLDEHSTPLAPSYDLAILINPRTGIDLSPLGSVQILDTRGGYV